MRQQLAPGNVRNSAAAAKRDPAGPALRRYAALRYATGVAARPDQCDVPVAMPPCLVMRQSQALRRRCSTASRCHTPTRCPPSPPALASAHRSAAARRPCPVRATLTASYRMSSSSLSGGTSRVTTRWRFATRSTSTTTECFGRPSPMESSPASQGMGATRAPSAGGWVLWRASRALPDVSAGCDVNPPIRRNCCPRLNHGLDP